MTTEAETLCYALIGDVGGTNTRLQLVSFTQESLTATTIKTNFYRTKDHKSLSECVVDFLKEFKNNTQYPQTAVLAVAGAPYEGRVTLPNTDWPTIDEKELSDEVQIKPFVLINDFVSIGFSIPRVSKEDIVVLHEAKRLNGGTMVVAGPGTGMGECILQPCQCRDGRISYNAFGTEGGHKNFAPNSPLEWEYLNFFMEENPDIIEKFGYVSTEKAFCGPGIPVIYKFFCKKNGVEPSNFTSEDIIKRGLAKSDSVCLRVLEFFVSLYAKEVADFALNSLPYGGIYLVGSLTKAVEEYLLKDSSSPFKASYFSKGKIINQVLERFPIYIVKEKELGLLGSFVKAQKEAFKLKSQCSL